MKQFLILILVTFSLNCFAAVEFKKFDTPQQEEAYTVLINELRCLVCQNQTIADSNAALAQDLRRQVYEMLQQGKTKDEIATFMTDRYGDFVLYNPPFKVKTGVLWIGPVVFLLIGIVIVVVLTRRKKPVVNTELSDEEQAKKAKVKNLLNDGEQ